MADEQVEVSTGALRAEAVTWEEQAAVMRQVAVHANGLRLNHVTAGIFTTIVNAYEGAVDFVSERSAEGDLRMAEVGKELRRQANEYDRSDEDVAVSFDGKY